jgi:DNA mismatch repair protein MSH2
VVLDLCRSRDVEQDLGRLVKGPPEQHKELVAASDAAAAALAALLTYTELLSDDTNYGKYIIQPYSLDLYMRLDAESKTDANKNFSLFGLMNRTCTQGMGKRLLNRWLKQPLVDVAEITRRLDTVQAFVEGLELRQELRSHLRRMPDIERLVNKLEKRKAGLQDVVRLYQVNHLPVLAIIYSFCNHACKRVSEKLWVIISFLIRFYSKCPPCNMP